MKRLLLLTLALLLCFCACTALAAEIETERLEMDNGLSFPVPVGWVEYATEADEAAGTLMMLVDENTGRCMALVENQVDEGATTDIIVVALGEDPEYAGMSQLTSDYGLDVVLYAYADGSMVSYAFINEASTMYTFSFLSVEDDNISADRELLQLVETCLAGTAYNPVEEAAAADGDIDLMRITDGPVFGVPAGWTQLELDDDDKENGCIAAFQCPDAPHYMMVMADQLGQGTTAQLAQALSADEEYVTVQLATNEHGLEIVLLISADRSVAGYCFVDDDCWMYQFLFFVEEGTDITADATIGQLLQQCVNNTYFE